MDVRDQRPPTDHTAFDMRRSKIIETKKKWSKKKIKVMEILVWWPEVKWLRVVV